MKQILVVEDEGGHAELIERALAAVSDRYRLTVTATLADARAALREVTPALALVDYRLPDGLGSSLVISAAGVFPVILMTAYGSERTAVEAIKAGALDYLVKSPETFADMPHVVDRALREWQHITDRRKAEDALHESENRFRRLFESTPHVAVRGYTSDGVITYWNQAGEMLYGYSAEEVKGRDLLELIVPPQNREAARRDLRQMAATGQVIPAGELVLMRKDGSPVSVFASHALLRGADGGPQLFSIDMDLTARKQVEEQRLEMERRLLQAQKLESLGVLAGGIAHDFNNLLTSILSNLELAMMDIPEKSTARGNLSDARTATLRAADLTRQMLAYSGRGRFQIKSLDLSDAVREMTQLLRVSIRKTATLHLALAADVPRIQADAAQVQQLVMNLIINASEALGDRPGSITVSTAVQECDAALLAASRLTEKAEPGRDVVLSVSDTGCGMDASVQERLFEPFFTTKFTGRGLGMSAVLGIVRGHKGAIFVDSAPNVGTSIRVLFPIPAADVPSAPPKRSAGSQAAAPVAVAGAAGTVLIVDDEATIRVVIERVLKRAGFGVISTGDGEEAVRLLSQHREGVRCVLLDLTMPKMDGVATMTELRRIAPGVPVILASGYDQQELSTRMSGLGFAGFVQKPYEHGTLLALIRQACQTAK